MNALSTSPEAQFLSTLSICGNMSLNSALWCPPRFFTQVPSGSNLVAPHQNRCLHLLHHFSKTKVPEASCPTAARQDQDWYLPDHLAVPGRWPTVINTHRHTNSRPAGPQSRPLSCPPLLCSAQPVMRSVPHPLQTPNHSGDSRGGKKKRKSEGESYQPRQLEYHQLC